MKQLVLLGDSHTRSFTYIDNVIPVFMGAGKSINLSTENIDNLKKLMLRCKGVLGDDYMFVTLLGEPNIRYQLKNNWAVHTTDFKGDTDVNTEYLDECIENYKNLFDELEFISYIVTPTTAYTPSLNSMKYFNDKLKETFGDLVIDTFSTIIENLDDYTSSNYEYDPIHLNSKLSNVLISELSKMNPKIKPSDYKALSEPFDCNDVRDLYTKSPFGTYTIENKK